MALVLGLASVGFTACGAPTQADNAAEFKERVSRSGIDVAFVPSDEAQPGLVAGVARTEDGMRIEFVFSFGPGPEKFTQSLTNRGTTWVALGDRFEYWIEDLPSGAAGPNANRYVRLVLGLENIGCRVVANRPCGA